MNARTPRPVARLALTADEAAVAIGVGRSMFYEQVLPQLRVVRIGSKRLVPIAELERWLAENASMPLSDELRRAEAAA